MRTTFPRSPAAVNGAELSHLVALPRESNSPSLGEWKAAGVRRCTSAFAEPNLSSWVAAMAVAAVPRKPRRSWLSTLGFQERQQVGVNGVRLSRGHAVWKALVSFQCAILQQLCRQRRRIGIRHDLVVIAMHHQDGHGDLLQIFGEVRLGEGDDAVIMRLCASHHALAPPIPDY